MEVFIILDVPNGDGVVHGVIDSQEEVEVSLSWWIDVVVIDMSFGTCPNRSKTMSSLFLFRDLVIVMSIRTTVLERDLITHSVVKLKNKSEEMWFHLNIILFEYFETYQLVKNIEVTKHLLSKVSSI